MRKPFLILIFSVTFLLGCSGTMSKLGINNDHLMPCPESPNCVNSQATDEAHSIQAIQFSGTSKQVQQRLLQILKTWNRAKTVVVGEEYIRAEFTSLVFRFVDDVEFYFPSKQTKKMQIHVRSASRIGYSDLGANRKRIEQIRAKFE